MEKILSISVAAYNLEKLINKNLESFVNAKNREKLEVIVTDDESKDKTAEIVEEYEKRFPGVVKLIKQKNAGPGSTVNSGIKNASGKYFKMVDGDDWVITDNLEKIIEDLEQNDADMILTNYQVFSDETKSVVETCGLDIPEDKVLDFDKYASKLTLAMHNITYKTKILQDNDILLDNCFYTDIEYVLLPIKYIKTFKYINLDLYVYLVGQANQSVNFKSMQKNIKMHNLVLTNLINYYENNKNNFTSNVQNFIASRISIMASNQLGTYLSFDDKKNMKKEIIKFNKFLKEKSLDIYMKYRKTKKAAIIIFSNYLFLNLTSKLFMKKNGNYRY